MSPTEALAALGIKLGPLRTVIKKQPDAAVRVVRAAVKKAYRRKALLLHPDRTGGDPILTDQFRRMVEAYELLDRDLSPSFLADIPVEPPKRKRRPRKAPEMYPEIDGVRLVSSEDGWTRAIHNDGMGTTTVLVGRTTGGATLARHARALAGIIRSMRTLPGRGNNILHGPSCRCSMCKRHR